MLTRKKLLLQKVVICLDDKANLIYFLYMKLSNVLKRFAEIVVAIVLLLLSMPFFILAAVLVQIDSPGSIIFFQKRVGKNKKVFNLYKLRTMKKGANGDFPSHTQLNDQRFSPLCRLIRATCIDEVPQLLNVIKGNMSFVGPRPELPKVVAGYTDAQLKIFDFTPGLFGISQLAMREGVDYKKKLELELAYYPYRSWWKDFLIIVFTPFILASHTSGKIFPFVKSRADYSTSNIIKLLFPKNGNQTQKNTFEYSTRGV